jgi:hypothetical protein
LCDLAAFVAARGAKGEHVAQSYASMAVGWTKQIRGELEDLRCQAQSDDVAASCVKKQLELQREASFSSALVVISLSYMQCLLSHPEENSVISIAQTALIEDAVVSFALARFFWMPSDAGDKLKDQQDRVWQLAIATSAASTNLWIRAAHESSHLLDSAAKELYPRAPTPLQWELDASTLGCFLASAPSATHDTPDTFGIYLLTGKVLLNGVPPSCLPGAILSHPAYSQLFGGLEFDVTDRLCTRHAIQERYYRFHLPDLERLLVFESRSDAEDGEVLEYLPGASWIGSTCSLINFIASNGWHVV